MNIIITLDYEIYFGENHGTVEKCIIYPTSELIRIGEKHNVRFSFFVDSGFILKLDEFRKKFPQLEKDYNAITTQVKYLSETGHDVQLHIHPHWEDSYYDGKRWIINVKRYKLVDFTEDKMDEIVGGYKKVLTDLIEKKIVIYRAGGLCLQPFSKVRNILKKHGITVDSSVYRGGHFSTEQYAYDFRSVPDKDAYKFEEDVSIEKVDGFFTEIPITAIKNSPLFFWKLFLLGRKNPYLHKPLGDGQAMAAPGYRKRLLTQFTLNPVAIDGYNANLLPVVLNKLIRRKKNNMVVIGHPKALSRYSIQKLEEFIIKNKKKHCFTTYTSLLNNEQ